MKGSSSSTAAIHSSIAAGSGSRVLAAVVVSAGVPGAAALLVVHADCDVTILGDGGGAIERRMGEAALKFRPFASASLELPTDLKVEAGMRKSGAASGEKRITERRGGA